ncbi:MAG: MFS transporter [Dehalococcoidia bacterium]|nr:MFS transporter [Dehalococcoidia bacterium]
MVDAPEGASEPLLAEGVRPGLAVDAKPRTDSGWVRAFATLRNPHFRMYWMGMLAYFMAMNMGQIARGWLAFDLTGRAAALGVVSLAWGAPMTLFSLLGGAIADRSDKRLLTLGSQAALFALAISAAVLVHTGAIQIWHLAVLAFLEGTVFSFAIPARLAWVPELIEEGELMNAIALNNAAMQATRIVGPGLAGALIGVPFFGMTGTFYLIACFYIVVFFCMLQVPSTGISDADSRLSLATRMMAGVRYIAGHDVLMALLILALLPVLLGAPFQIMLPVFAEDVYGVGPGGLGAMATMAGIGATAGSLLIGSLGDFNRRGTAQFLTGVVFGIGLFLFGLAGSFAMSLPVLALLGMSFTSYMVINNTLVLTTAERRYHGRVMAVYMLTWSMMPVVAMPVAALADVVGVQEVVVGLGVTLVVLMVAMRLFYPNYHLLNAPARALAVEESGEA